MNFLEKAKIRLEHWIEHSVHHIDEYRDFADQLDQEGSSESAASIREMIRLSEKSTECLENALSALKSET